MITSYPGVRFSIREVAGLWTWHASFDGVTLGQGQAATRAIAAAYVIAVTCRACAPRQDASMAVLPKAA